MVSEDIAPKYGKSQNFKDVLMVGGTNLTPTAIQTSVKYGDFAESYCILLLVFNKSHLNLAFLLLLRHSC